MAQAPLSKLQKARARLVQEQRSTIEDLAPGKDGSPADLLLLFDLILKAQMVIEIIDRLPADRSTNMPTKEIGETWRPFGDDEQAGG